MENKDLIVITLPLIIELFREGNKEFFNDSLPTPEFRLTSGRKALGSCSINTTTGRMGINISKAFKVTRDEAMETILHEMIHLWEWVTYRTMSHGTYFRAKAKLIQIKSNKRYNIDRVAHRGSYVSANDETSFKNKLYAVFVERDEEKAWIVACTPAIAECYNRGLTKCWNLDLVGFVKNRFEPDFDRLPKMSSSVRIKGRTMPWDKLNEKYSEFANCITTI